MEYDLDGLIQVQINDDIGLTFARCLRHFLRQDPDIILVGEIRDLETARDRRPGLPDRAPGVHHPAHQRRPRRHRPAAGPGAGAVPDHRDAGRHRGPAAGAADLPALQGGVHAHRGDAAGAGPHARARWPGGRSSAGAAATPAAAPATAGGWRIFEIMLLDDHIRDLIMKRSSTNVLREAARKRGMRTLRESGLLAIYDGMTTIEEVVSQTIYEETRLACRSTAMPIFTYEAMNSVGQAVKGEVERHVLRRGHHQDPRDGELPHEDQGDGPSARPAGAPGGRRRGRRPGVKRRRVGGVSAQAADAVHPAALHAATPGCPSCEACASWSSSRSPARCAWPSAWWPTTSRAAPRCRRRWPGTRRPSTACTPTWSARARSAACWTSSSSAWPTSWRRARPSSARSSAR